MTERENLTTDEFISSIGREGVVFIDIRSIDAYNGWPLQGESRGGHIQGARTFPEHWCDYENVLDIIGLKEIDSAAQLIFYGYPDSNADKVMAAYRRAGYLKMNYFAHFIEDIVPNSAIELETMPNFPRLVHPAWLKTLIEGGKAAHYNNDKFVLVHAHYRNREAYLSGHIPGAIDMDTLALEAPETWNRRSPAELKSTFPELHIHPMTGDYFDILEDLSQLSPQKKVILFLGSNVGNFSQAEHRKFFENISRSTRPGDMLIVGFDLVKDPPILEAAYNDNSGLTKAFNLNLLTRINRELNADFDLEKWLHHSFYDPFECEMKSFLISTERQKINIEGNIFNFRQWESIFIERSRKYDLQSIQELAEMSGFKVVENFFDEKQYFVDSLWQKL